MRAIAVVEGSGSSPCENELREGHTRLATRRRQPHGPSTWQRCPTAALQGWPPAASATTLPEKWATPRKWVLNDKGGPTSLGVCARRTPAGGAGTGARTRAGAGGRYPPEHGGRGAASPSACADRTPLGTTDSSSAQPPPPAPNSLRIRGAAKRNPLPLLAISFGLTDAATLRLVVVCAPTT